MTTNIAQLLTPHRQHPDRVLYRHFAAEAWRDVTVAEIERDVARWQAAFRRDGFVAGDRVAICARNGIAWVAMDLAALGMRLVVVPLLGTSTMMAVSMSSYSTWERHRHFS